MAYQVIARKYRPQRFSDVVGQEHVTRTLSQAIEQNRIAHAYLFCGPRGTGKTTIARIFAKCLNASNGPKVDFQDDDSRAREIAEGRSLDVLEIDAASNRGIDEIRGLRDTVRYAPASSRFKIYIIDEVHMLTKEAFNALLKTLEEPPEHVKFMFATTEPEKILPTILSRCQRFDLRRIPAALITKHLGQIAEQEKVQVAPAALHAIARGAEGAMRDAESTLDQLISFCGNTIQEPDVLSMFGLTAQSQVLELSRGILEGETALALRQLNELASQGKDLGRLLADLLSHFRNLLIFQVSRGDLQMLEVSEAEAAALAEQSKLASADGLSRIMEVFSDTEMRLRDAASKKILIEVALLKAVEARSAVSVDTLLAQLRNLRSGGGATSGSSAAAAAPSRASSSKAAAQRPATGRTQESAQAAGPNQVSETTTETEPSMLREPNFAASAPSAAAAAISRPDPNDLSSIWASLVESVGRSSRFTRSYLLEAHAVSLVKQVLTIGFPTEYSDHIALVDNPKNHALLQSKMEELGFAGMQFKFIKSDAQTSRAATPPAAAPEPDRPPIAAPAQRSSGAETQKHGGATARSLRLPEVQEKKEKPTAAVLNKEDFKNDPLIKKALEIFKGQIVDVRMQAQ